MNPLVIVAALGALLFLAGGSSAKAAEPTEAKPEKPKPAAKPKPPAAKPKPKPAATSSAAPAKPKPRTDGAPATVLKPKPKPTAPAGDDLQALIDGYDSANQPVKPKPAAVRPAQPTASAPAQGPRTIVDVPVPVNYVGPAKPKFDESKARKLAPALAKHITAKKYDFSRQSLRDFQTAAGLAPDGIYGPKSEGALRYYNNGTAPRALANPKKLPPEAYAPPN